MPQAKRTLALIGGGFALVTGIFVVVPAALFRLDPVTQIRVVQRARLESSGLSERALEGEAKPPVAYFEGDEGRPVMLMLHGFGDHAGTWAELIPALDDRYRVLAPDLPGHGESPIVGEALGVPQLLEAVERVVAKEAPGEPLIVVGNSLGGLLALHYTLRHPEDVTQLVLINSAGLAHPLPKHLVWATTPEDFQQKLDMIQGPRWPTPTPEFVVAGFAEEAANQPHLGALYDDLATGRWFIEDQAAQLQAPATLIWGSEDGYFPLDYAERMAKTLPHAELTVLEGCGHMPQVACPEEVTALLLGLPPKD